MSDSFVCYPDDNYPFSQEAAEFKDVSAETHVFEIEHLSLNCDQLIVAQNNYATISPFFEVAVAGDEVKSVSTGYFVRDGLLMPKWTPLCSLAADDWSVVTQIVVPGPHQNAIMNLAHDNPLAGQGNILLCFVSFLLAGVKEGCCTLM